MKSVNPAEGIPRAIRAGAAATGRREASAVFRALAQQQPSELDRKRIADALGFENVDDVPDYFESALGALWWLRLQQAFAGNSDAIADFLDRANPKPRRMEVTGADGGPVRAAIAAVAPGSPEAAAAQDYYQLVAGGERGDAD